MSLVPFSLPCLINQRNSGYFNLGGTVLDLDGDGHPDIYGSSGFAFFDLPATSACQAALSRPGLIVASGSLYSQTSPIPGPASVQAVFAGPGQLVGSVSTPATVVGPAVPGNLILVTLSVDGGTACGAACAKALHGDGTASLLASLVLSGQSGAGQAAENINGQMGSSSAVQLLATTPDSNGRFTFTMNTGGQPLDQPTHYAGYVVDGTRALCCRRTLTGSTSC